MVKATMSILCCALFLNHAFAAEQGKAYILSSKDANKKVSAPDLKAKQKADYEKRASSVQALTDALKRESAKTGVDNQSLISRSQQEQQQAKDLARAAKYAEAHELLEQTYQALRKSIVGVEKLKTPSATNEIDHAHSAMGKYTPDNTEKQFNTAEALLDALNRQNQEKSGGKETEIANLEAKIGAAQQAEQSGNHEEAKQLIQEANTEAKQQIVALQQPAVNSTPAITAAEHIDVQAQYDKKRNSLLALLDAGKRISDERGKHPAFINTTEAMLAEADNKWHSGQQQAGQAQLDLAYNQLKSQMNNLVGSQKRRK